MCVAVESNLALCKTEETTIHFILNFKHLFRLSSAAWCLSLNKHLWLILCRVSVLFRSLWTIVHCHGNCFETPRQLYQMIRCTRFIYLFIAWKRKLFTNSKMHKYSYVLLFLTASHCWMSIIQMHIQTQSVNTEKIKNKTTQWNHD